MYWHESVSGILMYSLNFNDISRLMKSTHLGLQTFLLLTLHTCDDTDTAVNYLEDLTQTAWVRFPCYDVNQNSEYLL